MLRSIWTSFPRSTQLQMSQETVSSKPRGRLQLNQQRLLTGRLSLPPVEDARLWSPRMASLHKQHQHRFNRRHMLQPTHFRHSPEHRLMLQSTLYLSRLKLPYDHHTHLQVPQPAMPTLLPVTSHRSRPCRNQVMASARLQRQTQLHLHHETSQTPLLSYRQPTGAASRHGTTHQTLAHQSLLRVAVLL